MVLSPFMTHIESTDTMNNMIYYQQAVIFFAVPDTMISIKMFLIC